MKYFYDTEFLENGRTIKPISIGIVAEDGREYYAVNSAMPIESIHNNNWLMKNVIPNLPIVRSDNLYNAGPNWEPDRKHPDVKARWRIASEVRSFLLAGSPVELWANYGAYDHVMLAQLWGSMVYLPEGIPMYTNDIQQMARRLGVTESALNNVPMNGTSQNAIDDARYTRKLYDCLVKYELTGNWPFHR